jgi:DNA-binding IscR family transcriptional regulator
MVATRFAVATHILLYLATEGSGGGSTSLRLAYSVNTNPVVVRRIAGQLARAGLIRVRRGPGGAELAREPDRITLEDVWHAVQAGQGAVLLPIHRRPNMACPVGRRVRPVLGEAFAGAEAALHQVLADTTLKRLTEALAR